MRSAAKSAVHALAMICISPAVFLYYVKSLFIGRDAALHGSSQALSLLPGIPGRYLRVAFLRCVLSSCDASACVEFGTLFSQAGARLGKNAYIGPHCHIGLADIEEDVLLAAGVHVPSGPSTHGVERIDIPIRLQPGRPKTVRVGAGSWVGSGAVVMADVGEHSVVGAGSVVIHALPAFCMAAGAPARVIRQRSSGPVAVSEH